MNKEYELKYHKIEEDYWWFVAHRDMLCRFIKKLDMDKNSEILDIGCSGGHLIQLLHANGLNNTCGIDISKKAINLCKRKGIKDVFVMDCVKTNFDSNTFDIVIAADILEHTKNDIGALGEWNRIIKPGGRLIISVPAFRFLWSKHDEVNQHYKRYNKSDLVYALEKSNFRVDSASYWNFSLFLPIAAFTCLRRIFQKKRNQKSDNLYELSPIMNEMLLALLKFENLIMEHISFPFGTSVFALAIKPKS